MSLRTDDFDAAEDAALDADLEGDEDADFVTEEDADEDADEDAEFDAADFDVADGDGDGDGDAGGGGGDFALALHLMRLCLDAGVGVDAAASDELMTGRCAGRRLRGQCRRAVDLLTARRRFRPALRLAALARLPVDRIIVDQLVVRLQGLFPLFLFIF